MRTKEEKGEKRRKTKFNDILRGRKNNWNNLVKLQK
jgi:hypothetical protein